MEECNLTPRIGYIPIYIAESLCVVNAAFLILVICLTPSLRGFSGVLLLNEQVACLIQGVSSGIFFYTTRTIRGRTMNEIMQVFRESAHSASVCLLFVINVNLCLAVCKGASYKTLITRKRIAVIIITTWIVCFVWGCLPLAYDFFVLDCDNIFLVANPNGVTRWRTVGYLLASSFIIIGSIVLLLKVRHHRTRVTPDYTLRNISATRNKLRLMKLTFVLVMIQAVTFAYTQLFVSFSNSDGISVILLLAPFAFVLDKIYNCFRLCFYLSLYKPMWETTKSLLGCCRVNANPRITNVTSTQPTDNGTKSVRPTRTPPST